ncbi:hypothetical protein ACTHGP_06085 [[Pasteurella] aerogenes]
MTFLDAFTENDTVRPLFIIDQPDFLIDFDSYNHHFSSTGKGDQARLDMLAKTIIPYWYEKRLTIHQLADYLHQFNINILAFSEKDWKEHAKMPANFVQFWLHFLDERYSGDVLCQCEILSRDSIH